MSGKIYSIAALIVLCAISALADEPRHRGPITDLLIHGKRILSCSQAGVMSTSFAGDDKRWLSRPAFRVYSLATISNQPDQVLLGGGLPAQSGILAILDAKTGTLITTRKIRDDLVYSVAFNPKTSTAAAACADGAIITLSLEDFTDGKSTTAHHHTATARDVAFSPNGSLLASCGHDGVVLVSQWENEKTAKPLTLAGHTAAIHCLTFSGNGTQIASGSKDGKIRLHSIRGSLLRNYSGLGGEVSAICWSRTGGIFCGNAGGSIYQLSLQDASSVSKKQSPDPVFSLVPLPNHRIVFGGFSLGLIEN